ILSTLTVSSSSILAGHTSILTATIRDANNNPISSGHIVSFDKVGGTSVGSLSAITNQGNGVYTAIYTGTGAGTPNTLQANVDAAGIGPTRTIQVLVGAPSSATSTLAINSSPLSSGSVATINAVVKDAYNNPITSEYTITFDALGGSSTGDLGTVSSGGGGAFSTTYTGLLAGSAQTIRVLADGIPIAGLTGSLQVVPGAVSPGHSLFTIGNSTVQSGTSTTLSLNLRDSNNNAISSGLTLTFNKTAAVSDGTISALTNNGNGNYSALYTGTTQGSAQAITLVVNGTAIPALAVSATVTAGPPSQIVIAGPSNPLGTTDCAGPYTVTLKDASNNTTSSLTGVSIAFSSAPAGAHDQQIFSDAGCSSVITSLSTAPLISTATFFYKSYVPQSFTFTLTPDGGIAAKSIALQNIPVLSWIGSAVGTFTFAGNGSGFIEDDKTGGFVTPQDTMIIGNYLYVVDSDGNRIQKYNLSTKQYLGWLGHLGTEEGVTGSCLASAVGELTGGWCLGSRAQSGTVALLNAPRGLGADATYLYVVAGTHRILRFRQTTGAYEGWIGRVSTTIPPAAGQLATCASPGTNTKTPGWCLGGTFTSGSGDGEFSTAIDVTVMGGKLYVTDSTNSRVQKFDATSGAFEGWMGRIDTVPASPTACANASTNDVTPTWCFGGTSKTSSRYSLAGPPSETAAPQEGFYNPQGIDNDGTYLYIADYNNRRIVRLRPSTATVEGWVGRVLRSSAMSPTSPTQTSGSYTTAWVQGGVSDETTGTTGFCRTSNVKYDGGYLYISDACHRVVRISSTDGQEYRWIGRAATSPTGGETGCSSTPIGGATPGWCLGGTGNKTGVGNSMFNTSVSTDTDTNYLYVIDQENARIQLFNKGSGAFVSWIGATRSTSSKWTRTPAALYGRNGFDDQSFTDMTAYWTSIATSGDFFFVPDPRIHRIKKHLKKTGEMLGYVGIISGLAPTGPDACIGYTSGMTPDWCTGGGRTTTGTGIHGYSNPYSVAADSTYVYIASNGNERVDRVRITDGLYMGWIGRVNATPTDGDPDCLTTATNSPTPTWCIGGTAKSGTGFGMLNSPRGIVYDNLASKLYVVDTGSISKIDPVSGVTEGVIGHVTAGAGGCTVYGTVVDKWCTTSVTTGAGTSNYGGVSDGTGITFDNTYIYVSDTANHRIHRFDKDSGAPAGSIGLLNNITNLNISAAGGACASLLNSGFPKPAPGWCWANSLGQAISVPTNPSSVEGAFNSPRGIWAFGGYLYISDSNNHRIVRVNAADGTFAGWKGYITSTSGMVDADCISAGVGGITPKWCTGGTAGPAQKLGAFDTPAGINGDANYLYIHDGRNNRLVTIPRN
ncbi:MAG: hypothetical protein KF789_10580, partial [Bdellovibrionaceae bacterium]|nr:hypothetical protein [Pseudobdellovibrionaceae bacterium]